MKVKYSIEVTNLLEMFLNSIIILFHVLQISDMISKYICLRIQH